MAAPQGPPPYSSYPPQGPPPGYPQGPPQGYYPPPAQNQAPIFHNQGPVVYQVPLGTAVIPGAVLMQPAAGGNVCRACNQVLVTTLQSRPTMATHCMAALLCLVGCWPCVCLPYCMDSCMDIEISCANCGAFVANIG